MQDFYQETDMIDCSAKFYRIFNIIFITQRSSTVYRDHEGLRFFVPQYHPKTSLILTL